MPGTPTPPGQAASAGRRFGALQSVLAPVLWPYGCKMGIGPQPVPFCMRVLQNRCLFHGQDALIYWTSPGRVLLPLAPTSVPLWRFSPNGRLHQTQPDLLGSGFFVACSISAGIRKLRFTTGSGRRSHGRDQTALCLCGLMRLLQGACFHAFGYHETAAYSWAMCIVDLSLPVSSACLAQAHGGVTVTCNVG
jgi:hypothetical protein